MKRKNINYTGKGIHYLDNNTLQQLYDGDFAYIKSELKYLQRRFHSEEYLDELKTKKQYQLIKFSHANMEQMLQEDTALNLEKEKRFKRFTEIHNGKKPLLVLDVDNTMIFARFFCDEMRIGDILTYFSSNAVPRNNAKVLQLQQTLTLTITNNEIIDVLGAETIKHFEWINDNNELKKYKRRGEIFFYEMSHPINQDIAIKIPCKVFKTQITGCKISVDHTIEYIEQKMTSDITIDRPTIEEITIDFTRYNDDLSRLEPMLNRPGMLPVDFIYEGFLIRVRPGLYEFLEYVNEEFDVVIYTAAKGSVYKGMLETLNEYIKSQLGREHETDLILWSDILFRKDCTLKYDVYNKPYHHKDLTQFGCDLSRVVMVDNSPIAIHKQEPNAIFIKDFFGKDNNDDQLMNHIWPMLDKITYISGDIRYYLCSLNEIYQGLYIKFVDLSTEEQCRTITQTFINTLKFNAPKQQQLKQLLSAPIYDAPKQQQLKQLISEPIVTNSYKMKRRSLFDKAHSIQPATKPLLRFEKAQSYERNKVYSSMAVHMDDKFDFDIGNDHQHEQDHNNDVVENINDENKDESEDIINNINNEQEIDESEEEKKEESITINETVLIKFKDQNSNNSNNSNNSISDKLKISPLDNLTRGSIDSLKSDGSFYGYNTDNITPIGSDNKQSSMTSMTSMSLEDLPKNVRFASVIGIRQYTVSESSKSLDLYNFASMSSIGSIGGSNEDLHSLMYEHGISENEEVDDYSRQTNVTMLNIFGSGSANQLHPSQIEYNVYDFVDVHSTDQEIIENIIEQYKTINDKKKYHEQLYDEYQKNENDNVDKFGSFSFEQKAREECYEEIKKRIFVLKQWKCDVIKSYTYEIKQDLFTFDEQQQSFFYSQFNELTQFFLNIYFIDSIFDLFDKELKQIIGKNKIKKITLNDIDNCMNNEDVDFLNDFEFIFKQLIDVLMAQNNASLNHIANDKSLIFLCDKPLDIINKYYNGEYVTFCSNILMQIILEMIDGHSTQNKLINDIISAIILILNDKKQILSRLYDELPNNRDNVERIISAIVLNMPPILQNNNDAIKYVMKVCYQLNIRQSVRDIINEFYEYFWSVFHTKENNNSRVQSHRSSHRVTPQNGNNKRRSTKKHNTNQRKSQKSSRKSSHKGSNYHKKDRNYNRHNKYKRHKQKRMHNINENENENVIVNSQTTNSYCSIFESFWKALCAIN